MADELVLKMALDSKEVGTAQSRLLDNFRKLNFEANKVSQTMSQQTEQLEYQKNKTQDLVRESERLEHILATTLRNQWNTEKLDEMSARLKKLPAEIDQSNAKEIELGNKIDANKLKYEYLSQEIEVSANKIRESVANAEAQTSATQGTADAQRETTDATKGQADAQKKSAKETDKTKSAMDRLKESASGVGEKIKGFGSRILGLAKRVFVFSLITKAFRSIRESIAETLQQDSEMNAYIMQLKGNLAVMGQTLYQSLRPVIEWILKALVTITNIIANIIAKVTGKDINEMRKKAEAQARATQDTAKASNKTAKSAKKTTKELKKQNKEMEKQLASWDTLQKFEKEEAENLATPTTDLETPSVADAMGVEAELDKDFGGITEIIQSELDKIMAIAGLALIAIGLILCAFGNLPVGIGCIAVGAMLYAKALGDWDEIDQETKAMIRTIARITGALLIAVGLIILCFAKTPKAIAIGFGAIVAGIAVIVTEEAIGKNDLDEQARETIVGIGTVVGLALIGLGILLLIFGPKTLMPLAIGCIVAGIGALAVALINVDWDRVKKDVKEILDSIGDAFSRFWAKIKEGASKCWDGLKWLINKIIYGANFLIIKLNTLIAPALFWVDEIGKKLGQNWNVGGFRIKQIPYLAKGAVIPGGKPFTAVLGDQPAGKTNIEAPEDLIRQIVREESGANWELNIKASQSWEQFLRQFVFEFRRAERQVGT